MICLLLNCCLQEVYSFSEHRLSNLLIAIDRPRATFECTDAQCVSYVFGFCFLRFRPCMVIFQAQSPATVNNDQLRMGQWGNLVLSFHPSLTFTVDQDRSN